MTQLNTFTSSADQRLDSLESESGSYLTSVPNAHINTSLNSYTSSNNNDITSIEGRLDNIESNTGSYDDQTVITSLNSFTASNGNDSLNSFTASNGNDSLNSFTASNGNDSLNSITSSFDQRLDSLEGESGSYNTITFIPYIYCIPWNSIYIRGNTISTK